MAAVSFGAVEWNAKVWVNGRLSPSTTAGTPLFAVDLAPYLRPGVPATLTVRVWDACDADTPLGKQADEWYTHSGGIWQTVWLEDRPEAYVSQVHVTPDLEAGRASFAVSVATAANAFSASPPLRPPTSPSPAGNGWWTCSRGQQLPRWSWTSRPRGPGRRRTLTCMTAW